MSKYGKRWAATGLAAILLASSWATEGMLTKNSEQAVGSLEQSLGLNSAKKVVSKEGNIAQTIQKIKVSGEIGPDMIDKELDYSILNQLKKAKEDGNVQAILLIVDSPGGGVFESREIYNAIKNLGKDVYVSMGTQATSGGYYISAPAKKIFAHEETITGSLGVIMGSLSAQEFFNKHGVKQQVIRSGEQKAVGGLYEDLNEPTIETYKELNKEMYGRFVDVISEGRKLSKEEVLKLADGRIYSASQALNNKLIDGIGNEDFVIEEIKKDKGLDNPYIVEYQSPTKQGDFLSALISQTAKAFSEEISKPQNISRKYLG